MDYSIRGLRAEFVFDSSGPGSGSYNQEFEALDLVPDPFNLPDTLVPTDGSLNDYRADGQATANRVTSSFASDLVIEWFESDGAVTGYPYQSFSLFIDNRTGLRDYRDASFSISMTGVFYGGGLDDDGLPEDDLLELLDFSFELPDILVGMSFSAAYAVTEVPGGFTGSLGSNQALVAPEINDAFGFIITATVPDIVTYPIGNPPGGGGPPTSVSEPGTLALLALGLLGLGAGSAQRGRRQGREQA